MRVLRKCAIVMDMSCIRVILLSWRGHSALLAWLGVEVCVYVCVCDISTLRGRSSSHMTVFTPLGLSAMSGQVHLEPM